MNTQTQSGQVQSGRGRAALPLILEDTYVRQDEHGRYSLNDLHQAAGGEKRHAPNEWLRNRQTQDLVAELSKPGIPGFNDGNTPVLAGTNQQVLRPLMAQSSGAAAPITPSFTLADARNMLHQHAYGGDRRAPAVATREQYSAFCEQLQMVENAAIDLANLGAGLYLLIGLLEDGSRLNVDPLVGKALRGLLQPMSNDLERHAAALQGACTRAPTTN